MKANAMPTWPRPEPKPRQQDDDRPSALERGYDSAWSKLRAYFLRRNPLCAVCGRSASVAHHIVPIEDGGDRLSEGNLQSMCRMCHEKHHGRVKATDF
jgi:5-methylcytosine-specific restriction endonuclease McrA